MSVFRAVIVWAPILLHSNAIELARSIECCQVDMRTVSSSQMHRQSFTTLLAILSDKKVLSKVNFRIGNIIFVQKL